MIRLNKKKIRHEVESRDSLTNSNDNSSNNEKKKIYFSQSQLIIIKAAALKTNKKEIEQLKEEMVPISSCTTPPVKLVKFPKTCT